MNVGALELKTSKSRESWRLYPIGDMHCDTKLFNEEKFRRYVKQIAGDPHGIWVSVGDYVDGTTPEHRYFHPEQMRDDVKRDLNNYVYVVQEWLIDLLKDLPPERGAMVEGNHDRRGGLEWAGFVPSICRTLGRIHGVQPLFLGSEGLLRITVRGGPSSLPIATLVHVQHGSGGGKKPGGKMNAFQDMTLATADADIYIRGHTEDAMARILPVYTMSTRGAPLLKKKYKAWVSAAGFYGNRVEGINTYAAEKGFPSVDEGTFYLEIWNSRNGCAPRRGVSENEKRMKRMEFV